MMGLLDSMNDPMMGLAMGLLSAGGPSARPVSLGQAMGQGYSGFQDAQKQQQEMMMKQAQAKIQQMQMAQALKKQQGIDTYKQTLPSNMQPLFDVAPDAVIANQFKDETPITLADGAALYKRNGERLAFNPKEQKPVEGYLIPDGAGGWKVDQTLYDAASRLKATGAPKVNMSPTIRVGNTFGEGVAKSAAETLTNRVSAAADAPQTAAAADQILGALNTGNVIAGPGTKYSLAARQLFGGDPSKLEATRATIQGLAKLSMQGRQSLKGQGQISDYEGKLLANAMSGNIDDMTVDEIRLIANGAKKNARYIYQQGQKASADLRSHPELSGVNSAFDLPDFPDDAPAPKGNKSTLSGGGWSAMRK